MRTPTSRVATLLPALASCLALAACGGTGPTVDDAVGAPPEATAPSPGPSPTSGDGHGEEEPLGGDGEQVWQPGDFPDAAVVPLRGHLREDGRGCWSLEIDGFDRLVALPMGSAPTGDRSAWVLPTGEELTAGSAVDVDGAVVPASTVAAVPDGYWGSLLAFCAPAAAEFVVASTMTAAFDPASLSDDEWSDAVASAEPAIDHGCGHGFASTTSDRRVAVQLTPADLPADRTAVTLPDAAWTATVTVGKDLLVDNCDDVLEQWETLPVLHATWPVVEGTLRIDGEGPLPSCTGATVTAVLAGAVVSTPTGRVTLDDISLVNDAYGCFAG